MARTILCQIHKTYLVYYLQHTIYLHLMPFFLILSLSGCFYYVYRRFFLRLGSSS